MPKGLDIISQFFRYSAQPINLGDARYVSHYAICFSDVCFSGPSLANGSWGRGGLRSGKVGGRSFGWPRLLLTLACSWKEPCALLLLLRSAGDSPKQFNGRTGQGEHRWGAHVAPQRFGKNRGHVRFVGYCTAWLAVRCVATATEISRQSVSSHLDTLSCLLTKSVLWKKK